jgi:hypothetical protein
LPEHESDEDGRGQESLDHAPRGVKNQRNGQGEEDVDSKRTSVVSLKFGSAHLDDFRRSSSIDFEDEFFTRMMALEASHHARGEVRASPTFFDPVANGAALSSAHYSPQQVPGQTVDPESLCALGMGGVQLPSSIKKLRRRTVEPKTPSQPEHPQGCAIRNAFSSMVYMIKAVQSHALQIRQVLFSEWDVQEVLLLVHREMHSSFVWLFQQVFACTPKLMVSVMLLLANFTVFSMGENVALASVSVTPAPIAFFLSTYGNPNPNPQAPLDPHFVRNPQNPQSRSLLGPSSAGSGGNNTNSPVIAENFDGDAWLHGGSGNANYVVSQKESVRDASARLDGNAKKKEVEMRHELMKAWVESSMKEIKSKRGENSEQQAVLEQETIRRLVAPVVAHLESDNYACFDRTDLEYQHALSKDPSNSLLLANYGQFLYVVRHDHDRAEGYFHQAMQADPLDSAILGRFASFLWLGRGNRWAAERAYKAAMAADPDSSFPASNYAHFLWHVGDGGESLGPMTV